MRSQNFLIRLLERGGMDSNSIQTIFEKLGQSPFILHQEVEIIQLPNTLYDSITRLHHSEEDGRTFPHPKVT
jgi:hypothetical protein